ncbi:MAG TPA: L-glutamate gamma-semialdehyde dehydrogenase [Planctomycetota bacterium]|nr:L-glutamate gamma-semialdehyde dehydrogenase [Planctomycetota bacterium]HRU51897.1 L-glutamate gamma-semialdehyde dehydrogenase [Planctomycetota bacterium]
MNLGLFKVPEPVNEPIKNYAPGEPEREALLQKYNELKNQMLEIPVMIGGKEIKTGNTGDCRLPHDHQTKIGFYHKAGKEEVKLAIQTALEARKTWSQMPFEHRISVFLKAAELISKKYRNLFNAACMLIQSKTCYQAEIDIVCELVDFFRFNAKYAQQIYADQPISSPGVWNWVEYRPLEGFIFAITPFNFTSIASNLPTCPAMMGNVVVWKPASSTVYTAKLIMDVLKEAGLPDGVINMIPGAGSVIGDMVIEDPNLAGVHFTGSTEVFQNIWKTVGMNIAQYKSYPRLVGETGGKDFMVIHKTADVDAVVTAIIRGSFEYQGQKCSAASRAYIPDNLWPEIKDKLEKQIATIKVGDVADYKNFMGAVIDKNAFDNIVKYLEAVKASDNAKIIIGGTYDDSKGYFIQPTIIQTQDPHSLTMEEEIFGPVMTVYVYAADEYSKALELCNTTSKYALTGGIFAQTAEAIKEGYEALRDASGNFYINDKVTGAVVGQQPFGGARASGTNDKAGSYLNLLRWVSARSIKEVFVPATNYEYPHMK